MKQTDEEKLKRSRAFLQKLKEARGGKIMDSHRTMGNDPSLVKMFLEQYVNCNKKMFRSRGNIANSSLWPLEWQRERKQP
ncbi:hypothetical protein M5E89_08365 [Acidaminococcus intestini]|nr:hypothetical protein M5E89_08365 [Acidaminococcus intestini]